MARESDVDPTGRPQSKSDELATSLQRFAASQRTQARADLNVRPPTPRVDPVSKKLFYDYAPRPLTRLLGSPLAMTGKNAMGPKGERRIGSGWGDSRLANVSADSPRTFHKGIDYVAPLGEAILACGDGKITFVGYQGLKGGVSKDGLQGNADNDILDANGTLVARAAEVGFGGIVIFLVHNDDDFQGYRTEYYHLSRVNVKQGQTVQEGDVIGFVGRSGVRSRGVGPHLHFQISFISGKTTAVVPPTAMVPNYWPGHTDSTNSEASKGLPVPVGEPAALQVVANSSANLINGIYRSVTLQNQDIVQVRQNMAAHAERVAQIANVQETALYAATAAAQGQPPVVESPMTFDFERGVWLVNGQDNGVV